jgi:hypothetical protein
MAKVKRCALTVTEWLRTRRHFVRLGLTCNRAQPPARRPTDEHRCVVALAACVSTNPKDLGLGAHLVGPCDWVGRCTRVPDNVSNESVSEQMKMALINCKHQA